MAITLAKLCQKAYENYRMQLIAGKGGLYNVVSWVHIIEDVEVSQFLNGNELVFTTGIGNIGKDSEAMISYIAALIESNASALVINIGPYISKVDRKIIEYCDEKNFPLYVCPWETRLVDVTRGLCEKIFNSETNEKSLVSNVKDYIFYPAERKRIQEILERRGLQRDINYCVIFVGIDTSLRSVESDNQSLEIYARREIEKTQSGKYVLFWYERKLVIVTAGMSDSGQRELMNSLLYYSNTRKRLYIAVSSNEESLNSLDVNFERARDIYSMCVKKNVNILYYNTLGIEKVLLSVKDKKVLNEIERTTLGGLIQYDKNNGTDLYDFLKIYIDNDGSVKKTADDLFIHRNTVNYKISKIESIINMDITKLDNLLLIKMVLDIEKL